MRVEATGCAQAGRQVESEAKKAEKLAWKPRREIIANLLLCVSARRYGSAAALFYIAAP